MSVKLGNYVLWLFDDGWLLAYRQVVQCEGCWPRYETYQKLKRWLPR